MAGDLNSLDIEQLKARKADLEQQLVGSKVTAANVQNSKAQAEEQERAYKKDWDYFNRVIRTFEKEIEYLVGTYIKNPLSESDLQQHVRNSGRLHQPTISLDPKKIAEMVGGGAKGTRSERENRIVQEIEKAIEVFRTGFGPNSGATSVLARDFAPGDRLVYTEDPLTANTWYFINGRSFVKLGAPVEVVNGECDTNPSINDTELKCTIAGGVWTSEPPSFKHQVIDRLAFSNAEAPASIDDGVAFFNGFPNTIRETEVATAYCSVDPEINLDPVSCGLAGGIWTPAPQDFFNVLKAGLINLMNRWKNLLIKENAELDKADKDDPEFDKTTPKSINDAQIAYIDQYLADGAPVDDDTPGFNELETQTAARLVYIPTRVSDAENDKKKYYGDRIQLTNGRANRQAGSLFRTLFVGELAKDFPTSGDPDIVTEINRLDRRIRQLEGET